jgi:MOSC domain-containing protein YiiM
MTPGPALMARLVSIQVGVPRWNVSAEGERWRSAFFKEPVAGPLALDLTNLEGDRQADLRVHGGPDMAALCYSFEHYARWRDELAVPEMGPGGFGENFTIAGQHESTVCIGDVYEVGDAVVQVSQPRGPCVKISRRWERPDLLRRVEETGRHGWYLRVLQRGTVEAGLELRLVRRPHPEWTVRRAADTYRWRKRDQAQAAELADCPALAAGVRAALMNAVER